MTQSKLAVITGGSSGMGFHVAREMARRGNDLVLNARTPDAAAETIRNEFGVRVECVAGSIAEPEVTARIAAAAEAMGGTAALLLNHGGPPVKPLMELTEADWQEAFEMMVQGPLRLLRAIVPQMLARGEGRILAISSFTVKSPYGGIALSNSLRAALVNALKTAALELGPKGILVNALAPGYVETDRTKGWNDAYARAGNTTIEAVRNQTLESIPLRRYGTPEGFARMAALLLSADNDYVSGQQILYDGALITAN
ncbi:SDR family oxidoreductase [Shinella sp.]|uniref:SDR family oxidoreductase n=1 Tax=Shinella sp. TaxID=1870904 RepID=UPI003F6F5253